MLRHSSNRNRESFSAVKHAAFHKLIAKTRYGGKAEMGGFGKVLFCHSVTLAKAGNDVVHIVYPDILSVH
jgi:hypothetical protein